jgi:hypothetical protein
MLVKHTNGFIEIISMFRREYVQLVKTWQDLSYNFPFVYALHVYYLSTLSDYHCFLWVKFTLDWSTALHIPELKFEYIRRRKHSN